MTVSENGSVLKIGILGAAGIAPKAMIATARSRAAYVGVARTAGTRKSAASS